MIGYLAKLVRCALLVIAVTAGCRASTPDAPLFDNNYVEDLIVRREQEGALRKKGISPLTKEDLNQALAEAQTEANRSFNAKESMAFVESRLRAQRDQLSDAEKKVAEESSETKKEQFRDFAGVKFGVGPSLKFGGRQEVDSASVVNGVVRVSKESEAEPMLLIETHYFFTPGRKFLGVDEDRWGFGPFLGIQASEDEIIDSFAFGLMIGFRYDDEESKKPSSRSFNLGIGAIYDDDVKVLGDGIVDGQPLPVGETDVRFREVGDWAWVITFSFSFSF